MFLVSIGVNRCVRIQRTFFLDFLIACQRGWWCTMDTPIPHLENWLKKLTKEKKSVWGTNGSYVQEHFVGRTFLLHQSYSVEKPKCIVLLFLHDFTDILKTFTVTICACADKGHSDQDCEIAIDFKYWTRRHKAVSCIFMCALVAYWNVHGKAFFSTNLTKAIHAALL